METLQNFFNKNGFILIFIILFIILLQMCGTNSSVKSTKKEIKTLESKNDSSIKSIQTQIQIEGLNSEKRMIQATDRKLMDVNRQFAIENEIKSLENKK